MEGQAARLFAECAGGAGKVEALRRAGGEESGHVLSVGISVEPAGLCAVEGAADEGLVRVGDQRFGIADGEPAQPVAARAGAILMIEGETGRGPGAGGPRRQGPGAGEQQPQVIQDPGRGSHGRTRMTTAGAGPDGDGRGQSPGRFEIGPAALVQAASDVRREAFQKAPPRFGEEGIENQG